MRYLSITCPQRALRLFSSVQHTLKRQTPPPSSLKRREFDVFKPHKYTVSCGVPKTPKKSEFWWNFDVSFGVLKILVY